MHRRITKAIKLALTQECNDDSERFKITIYRKIIGDFWEIKIVLKPRFKHLTKHIEQIAYNIGGYYGERVSVNVKARTIWII